MKKRYAIFFLILLVGMPTFLSDKHFPSFLPDIPSVERAQATFNATSYLIPLEDCTIKNEAGGYGDYNYASWLKFDISAYAGTTIIDAQLKFQISWHDSNFDRDVTIKRIANQTWVESNSNAQQIADMTRDMTKTLGGVPKTTEGNSVYLDVSEIVQAEITASHSNFSLFLEDPDYPWTLTEAGSTVDGTGLYLWWGRAESGYQTQVRVDSKDFTWEGDGEYRPCLFISTGTPYHVIAPLDDTYFRELIYGECVQYVYAALIKFNISNIPTDLTWNNAILRLNVLDVLGTGAVEVNAFANQTWTEEDTTISRSGKLYEEDITTGLSTGTQDLIVTNSFNYAYENSYTNVSFYITELDNPLAILEVYRAYDDDLDFGGKDCYPENTASSRQSEMTQATPKAIAPQLILTPTAAPSVEEVTVTVQPATIIPSALIGLGQSRQQESYLEAGIYGFRIMETNDNQYYTWRMITEKMISITLEFSSRYSAYSDTLTYDLINGGATTPKIYIYDFNPARTKIAEGTTTLTGTHTIEAANWYGGKLQVNPLCTSTADANLYLKIDQLTVNFTAIEQTYPLTTFLDSSDDKTELQSLSIPILEPNTNITISGIATSYSLDNILPQCNYTDTISSNGNLVLYNTAATSYTVTFATGKTKHVLHMAAHAQDGLGLKWEAFKWYLNNSRVPFPQEHELYAGTYALVVRDFYEENVATGSFTILATDPRHTFLEVSILHYLYTLGNWDRKEYTANVTRNARTTSYSLAGYPCSISFYLFGTVNQINYTVEYFDSDGTSVGSDIITMENDAQAGVIDYLAGDEIPEVAAPAGAAVIYQLDILLIILAISAVFGLVLFSTYRQESARRKAKPKKKKPKLTDVVSISRELKEKAKKEKERSKDYEKS